LRRLRLTPPPSTTEMVIKIAIDPSKGWTKGMLAPVAALWYPPEMWARHSEAVFDNDSYLLPDEEIVLALDKELKKVEAFLAKKQADVKSLLQADFQIEQELVDREVKKRKDVVRALEYKQWKLLTNIDRGMSLLLTYWMPILLTWCFSFFFFSFLFFSFLDLLLSFGKVNQDLRSQGGASGGNGA